VGARLTAAHGWPQEACELRVIRTSGDRIQDRPLREAGGKGLFTKEIEEALLAGEVDIAVHSMKDLPARLPAGLEIACLLEREDARDAFVSKRASAISELASGAAIGTSALRRQAQLRRLRPDLNIVPMRGNVGTRIGKLDQGLADALVLACAGLKRLGLADRLGVPIPVEQMLPAIAQGAIGVEIRSGDAKMAELLGPLHHEPTGVAVSAERAFLGKLDGSCLTPIAGFGELVCGLLVFRGMILSPDGALCYETRREGRPGEAIRLGEEAAEELRRRAGPHFFEALR
jgi:hydroxymethylbilane synthase